MNPANTNNAYSTIFERLHSRPLYEFANWVQSATLGELDDELDAMWDDEFATLAVSGKAKRPHKHTLLHDFINTVCEYRLQYLAYDAGEHTTDYFAELFTTTGITVPKWLTVHTVPDHCSALYQLACKANRIVSPSVFYVLFSDRGFLHAFQERLSVQICEHSGIVSRTYVPAWLKQAVMYRDRGRCQECRVDLTGWNRPPSHIHLDHIIPLAMHGSNDPTNFQLLCDACNGKKGKKLEFAAPVFAAYW